ncbi:MAG: acyl-CoA thioesterase [Planctomycetota bacterium]|jgi:acyl-CoA thioesterase YciA|nr:acyl-CoA thioesterase [Planctomycetota bacterium]|tara:strand:- start:89 stop:466 length:378 start_codon:yes stop_codon:yes gene_type:complete
MTKDTCELALRTILLPRDTNASGSIFGGVILSHIDIAGAVPAKRLAPSRQFVTIAMNEVVFHEPVFVGDIISFYASVKKVGNTSITVEVDVIVERKDVPGSSVQVTSADVTYVAVDENRRPVAIS